jgi:hypothetical protein
LLLSSGAGAPNAFKIISVVLFMNDHRHGTAIRQRSHTIEMIVRARSGVAFARFHAISSLTY